MCRITYKSKMGRQPRGDFQIREQDFGLIGERAEAQFLRAHFPNRIFMTGL